MEYNKLVSVVMPVHNGERFLREAIESVLNQTYTNFEFLIIENCSTDSSLKIIKSYNDPRIRVIIEEDCGQVQAYNRGFKESKGEYIFIHDHDDISHHERFEKQLEYIIENNFDIVGSYYELIDYKGVKLTEIKPPIYDYELKRTYYYKVTYLYNPTLCLKNIIFEHYGYFDKSFFPSSDYEFGLRVITKVKVGNVPEILLKWRNHSESLSHQNEKYGIANALFLACKYLELNKDNYSRNEYVLIKANNYYYYNKLLKSIKVILDNIRIIDLELLMLFFKIIVFFFQLKY